MSETYVPPVALATNEALAPLSFVSLSLRAKRLSRLPRAERLPRAKRGGGGAKRGESNFQPHIVIASEAKQSPSHGGDCFVAALLAMTLVERLRAKRLSRLPRAERGGAERGESNFLCLIVIASEAKQSPPQGGDCFVAALLAMTLVETLRAKRSPACHGLWQAKRGGTEQGGAKRGESTPCRLRSAVCGPLSGIALPPTAACNARRVVSYLRSVRREILTNLVCL